MTLNRIFTNVSVIANKHQRTPRSQPKKGNPEKLTKQGTQDTRRRQTKQKHDTMC